MTPTPDSWKPVAPAGSTRGSQKASREQQNRRWASAWFWQTFAGTVLASTYWPGGPHSSPTPERWTTVCVPTWPRTGGGEGCGGATGVQHPAISASGTQAEIPNRLTLGARRRLEPPELTVTFLPSRAVIRGSQLRPLTEPPLASKNWFHPPERKRLRSASSRHGSKKQSYANCNVVVAATGSQPRVGLLD